MAGLARRQTVSTVRGDIFHRLPPAVVCGSRTHTPNASGEHPPPPGCRTSPIFRSAHPRHLHVPNLPRTVYRVEAQPGGFVPLSDDHARSSVPPVPGHACGGSVQSILGETRAPVHVPFAPQPVQTISWVMFSIEEGDLAAMPAPSRAPGNPSC